MMKRNREGNLVGDVTRECSSSTCDNIFTITSKTVTLCPHCNSERVKSAAPEKKMLARARSRAKERHFFLISSGVAFLSTPRTL